MDNFQENQRGIDGCQQKQTENSFPFLARQLASIHTAAIGSDLVIPFECPPLIVREEIFCNVTIKEKNGLYGPAPLHKPVLLGLARCSTVKNENYLILSQVKII